MGKRLVEKSPRKQTELNPGAGPEMKLPHSNLGEKSE